MRTWTSHPEGAGHPWRVQGERGDIRSQHLSMGSSLVVHSFHPNVRVGSVLSTEKEELAARLKVLTLTSDWRCSGYSLQNHCSQK